jgi:Erv1 / Alr family
MSASGIKTSFWGPHAWAFLFSSIAGSFPVKVDTANASHRKIVKSFQCIFDSLEYTLPCIYCRQSYGKFIKEVPIENYTSSRRQMMYWLYLIHDKVNKKLILQEKECVKSESKRLQASGMSPDRLKGAIKKIKQKTLLTKPSPPFEKVQLMYEKQRAGCSKQTMRCS